MSHRLLLLGYNVSINIHDKELEDVALFKKLKLLNPAHCQCSDLIINLGTKENIGEEDNASDINHDFHWTYSDDCYSFRHKVFSGTLKMEDGISVGSFKVRKDTVAITKLFKLIFSVLLPRKGAIVVHASCVAYNGRAILFPGLHDSGKTTIARLLEEELGLLTVSEDSSVLRPKESAGPMVESFPFTLHGDPAGVREQFPLFSILFLNGWGKNSLNMISKKEAISKLLRNTIRFSFEHQSMQSLLDVASAVIEKVPSHKLNFTKDSSAAGFLAHELNLSQ